MKTIKYLATRYLLLATICCALCINVKAQDEVLMTINGEPITKAEFEYIYNKNNSDNAIDKKHWTNMWSCS